jgi:hypothetical protein
MLSEPFGTDAASDKNDVLVLISCRTTRDEPEDEAVE